MDYVTIPKMDIEVRYFDEKLEQEIYGGVNPYSDGASDLLRAYCAENNAYYYADVKEEFSVNYGIREARKRGCSVILCDNLS